MLKTLLILSLLPFVGFSQEQKPFLHSDYSFLGGDGEVKKLHMSNDTLYEQKCYVDRPCQSKPAKHYKILSSNTTGNFTIMKLEGLDTIALTSDPYPAARYHILALRGVTDKQLGYLPLVFNITKKQLDTVNTNVEALEGNFFFTYFSDSYLKELSALKKLTTKDEVLQVIQAAKGDKYKSLTQRYAKTETKDMYNVSFMAELLSRACIDNGYSPIDAVRIIDQLVK